ncbi:MAG: aspartate dehydrogenase [Geminicoccaceae bacterium]|nr:aspartate dehydrogenase [Geminicoccaceae bacterium]
MRVGMIGLGAIGGAVLDALRAGRLGPGIEIVSVLVRRPRPDGPLAVTEPARFFAARPEAVVEVAGHEALRRYGIACLEAGADLLLTSAGALVDDAFRAALEHTAAARGRRVVVLSAGIGALDALAAAAEGGLARVRVTVRKDPSAWRGTPAETIVDLDRLRAPRELFRGPVREGARLYPQNVNIAAAAALAGAGLDRTELVVVADPRITEHHVAIEAEGAFGSLRFEEKVRPSAANPKTGVLVAMAVLKSLRRLVAPLRAGD